MAAIHTSVDKHKNTNKNATDNQKKQCMRPSPHKLKLAELLHRRLGHASHRMTRETNKVVRGLNYPSSQPRFCPCCISGNSTTPTMPTSRDEHATAKFQRVHTDLIGKMQVRSINGQYAYAIAFTDEYTRFTHIYFMKKKSEAVDKLQEYITNVVEPTGSKIHELQMDGGGEYEGSFTEYCHIKGISDDSILKSAPDCQSQNGISERVWRTVAAMARRMLCDAKLPSSYWHYAMAHSVWIKNRMVTRALPEGQTPYELFHNKLPSFNMNRVFGSPAYVH